MTVCSTKSSHPRRTRVRGPLPTKLASYNAKKAQQRNVLVKQVLQRENLTRHSHAARRPPCHQWATIGQQTAGIVLGDGKYVETRRCRVSPAFADSFNDVSQNTTTPIEETWHILHDISAQVRWSIDRTILYTLDTPLPSPVPLNQTRIEFSHESSLATARRYSSTAVKAGVTPTHIGVLSSASSRRPGGGFKNSSFNHDAVLSRSTSLIASLTSSVGRSFYQGVKTQPSAVLYSPQVVGLRKCTNDDYHTTDDDFDGERDAIPADPTTIELERPPAVDARNQRSMGEFVAPYAMNVLSALPVRLPRSSEADRDLSVLRMELKYRLTRALAVFAAHGDAVLVLSPFGCYEGLPANMVAEVYAELLACTPSDKGTGQFKNVFQEVVFAVPGGLHEPFRMAFELCVYEDELTRALEE